MGRSVFLQGWGTEAAASVGSLPRSPSQRLHPPGLGTPPALLAALSAWEGGPRSGALGPLSSFPARPRPLQPPPPWDHHLLCRRGKVLEIRGLAVSAKEKQFS